MGNKRLEKEWQQQVWKQRGSIGTRKSRLTTMRRALEIFEEQDVHIEGVDHLKLKHIHMLLNACMRPAHPPFRRELNLFTA